jgi:hypothetical protein
MSTLAADVPLDIAAAQGAGGVVEGLRSQGARSAAELR